jgi:ABC-type transport system substrate-binding protein
VAGARRGQARPEAPGPGGAAVALALLGAAAALSCGCDQPARSKPWRHAADPAAEAARAPSSPALAASARTEPVDALARAGRGPALRIHVDADPGRLSPLVAPTVWARRIAQGTIFEPLIRYVPPEPGQPAGRYAPRLARSWRVSPLGTEILVELEPDVRFHDGRPLTAVDVQFTLETVRDPRRGVDHLRQLLADVDAVELVTPTALRVRLARPSGYVLRALAEVPILPYHVYEASPLGGGAVVGTGPWRLASSKGGVVHLARFDRYWGPPPGIGDVELVYQPDAAVALREAKRGALDLIPAMIPAHWPAQASAPGIAAAFAPLELRPLRFRYLAFNASRPILADPRVRHALGLLVHRREIEKRVLAGLARPALWPIWPGGLVHGPEPAVPAFDPAAAVRLLEAAGWVDSAPKDGVRDRDGTQLRLVMVGAAAPARDAALPGAPPTVRDVIVEAARRNGVVIEVVTGSEAWLEKRLAEGSFDLAERVVSGMVDSDVARWLGGGDPALATSPRIARALAALAAAWDPAERARLSSELAAALAEVWPIAGIAADAPQGLIHRSVRGARPWDGWIDLTQLRVEPARP